MLAGKGSGAIDQALMAIWRELTNLPHFRFAEHFGKIRWEKPFEVNA